MTWFYRDERRISMFSAITQAAFGWVNAFEFGRIATFCCINRTAAQNRYLLCISLIIGLRP
jgi:hypothetical protein